MSSTLPKLSESSSSMLETFSRLRSRIEPWGLHLSLWDSSGRSVEEFRPDNEYCRLLCGADGPCDRGRRDLAERVLAIGRPARDANSCGCCLLGVPVFHRRRPAGAVVAVFPVRDLPDQEQFARTCAALEVDRQVAEDVRRRVCRHNADEAEFLLEMLAWVLESEQARDVARSEIDTLSVNLASTYEELSLLYRVSGSMNVTRGPGEFMQNVCDELLEGLDVRTVAAIVYARHSPGDEDIIVAAGDAQADKQLLRRFISAHVAPRFDQSNRPIIENRFSCDAGDWANGVKNFTAVPLVAGDGLIGALVALDKPADGFNSVDVELVRSVASQAAVFLANNRLYDDLQDLLMGVLHALTATIDAKDPYTCGHSRRVAMISGRLAEQCGFGPGKVREIYLAGLLHDIGKVGVPEATLRKEGKLTDAEYRDIKRHPALSAEILGGIRQLEGVIVGIRSHHERIDGKGYPRGLAGPEFPIEGRIVGLADAFDAMTSDRTYRKALPMEDVIDEIRRCAGTQFDPDLAARLLSLDLRAFKEDIRASSQTEPPYRC